ncbi:MAG: DUF3857 domain-containing transglutaminase family protein, partial [Verrucomicrobiota bacterium]
MRLFSPIPCQLVGWLFLAGPFLAAGDPEIPTSLRQAAAVPDWVELTEIAMPEEIPRDEISNGQYQIYYERQWHVPKESHFSRSVIWVLDEAGLEENGERTFSLDPEFQTLHLHWLRILRDGKEMEQFDPAQLRFFATESDHSMRLLDGSQTAMVVLEDLRVGDVIDAAYTYSGTNPALRGEAVHRRRLGWGSPVRRHYHRILAEPEQKLTLKSFLEADPKDHGVNELGLREWRLLLEDTAPVYGEGSIPREVRLFPELQVSSFETWEEVTEWALALYPEKAQLPKEVRTKIREIRRDHSDSRIRAKEALDFVQSNVRYLGLEMGNGAYQPRLPGLVWKRRFGDCKDKALLLTQILRSLEIEAWPALVNTGWGAGIETFLPSPLAFNHVIVHARIGDTGYWLDPTNLRFVGPLDRVPVESYGLALLVRPGNSSLSKIVPHPEEENYLRVTQTLEIRPPGEESR